MISFKYSNDKLITLKRTKGTFKILRQQVFPQASNEALFLRHAFTVTRGGFLNIALATEDAAQSLKPLYYTVVVIFTDSTKRFTVRVTGSFRCGYI